MNLILEIIQNIQDAYNHFQKQIHEKMKIYGCAAQIIEHALLEMKNTLINSYQILVQQ